MNQWEVAVTVYFRLVKGFTAQFQLQGSCLFSTLFFKKLSSKEHQVRFYLLVHARSPKRLLIFFNVFLSHLCSAFLLNRGCNARLPTLWKCQFLQGNSSFLSGDHLELQNLRSLIPVGNPLRETTLNKLEEQEGIIAGTGLYRKPENVSRLIFICKKLTFRNAGIWICSKMLVISHDNMTSASLRAAWAKYLWFGY